MGPPFPYRDALQPLPMQALLWPLKDAARVCHPVITDLESQMKAKACGLGFKHGYT